MPNLLFPVTGGGAGGSGTTYEYIFAYDSTTSVGYVEVLSHMGPGRIYQLRVYTANNPGSGPNLRLTIDGYTYLRTITGSGASGLIIYSAPNNPAQFNQGGSNFTEYGGALHFKDEFTLDVKSDGAEPIITKVHYSVG